MTNMPNDLKQTILQNQFLGKLRNEMVVDRRAFEALCQSLRELEQEWKSASNIDKELVQELYVLAPVTRNMADSLTGHRPDLAREIAELAEELDGLVLDCLSS